MTQLSWAIKCIEEADPTIGRRKAIEGFVGYSEFDEYTIRVFDTRSEAIESFVEYRRRKGYKIWKWRALKQLGCKCVKVKIREERRDERSASASYNGDLHRGYSDGSSDVAKWP